MTASDRSWVVFAFVVLQYRVVLARVRIYEARGGIE